MDAEPEMGPVIASVSLGGERLFRLRRKDGSVAFSERLAHGSLLIMAGETQKNFKHEVAQGTGRDSATHQPDVPAQRAQIGWFRFEHGNPHAPPSIRTGSRGASPRTMPRSDVTGAFTLRVE